MKRKTFATVRKDTGDEGIAEAWISTTREDRDGDVLVPEGCERTDYLRNPVVLCLHGMAGDGLPVGRAIAVTTAADGIRARWRWAQGDPFAARVANLWRQGVLGACSVGFIPRESKPRAGGGRTHTRWELVEFSVVALPSNPGALRLRSLRGDAPIEVHAEPEAIVVYDDARARGRDAIADAVLARIAPHVRGDGRVDLDERVLAGVIDAEIRRALVHDSSATRFVGKRRHDDFAHRLRSAIEATTRRAQWRKAC